MAWHKYLQFFLIASLAVLTLVMISLVQKPLCIDSKVVERIDRISPEKTERLWACRFDLDVPFSPWMKAEKKRLDRQLQEIERGLSQLAPFRHPLRIVVLPHRPKVFRVHAGVLFIGEELFQAEGHLQRGLIKAWLRERNAVFGEGELREEILTDLFQFALLGKFEIEDPSRALKTKLAARYPQVLKDSKTYCASPWKLSEHIEFCHQEARLFADQSWLWSLRPLLTVALIEAWGKQSVLERISLLNDLSRALQSESEDVFAAAPEQGFEGVQTTLLSLMDDLERRVQKSGEHGARFFQSFRSELQALGWSRGEAQFTTDWMITTPEVLRGDEPWLEALRQMDQGQRRPRIAIRDPEGLWLMPTRHRLPLAPDQEIPSHRRIVLHCGEMSFETALGLSATSERLIVIESCDGKVPKLATWMSQGPEAFAAVEKEVRFVQLHLPSLARAQEGLAVQKNLFDQENQFELAETLGWEELVWMEEIKAYRPRAQIDAIEWFRLEGTRAL